MNFLKKLFCIHIQNLPDDGDFILPSRFWPFIAFFVKQAKWLLVLIAGLAAAQAVFISLTYWYIGEIVEKTGFEISFLFLGLSLILLRALAQEALRYCENVLYLPHFKNMVIRQCLYYTSNLSISYFLNELSGKISNNIMQCGAALRDAILSVIVALILISTLLMTNIALIAKAHILLVLPQIIWVLCYILIMAYFLPRIKGKSTVAAKSMNMLTGQIVDMLSNILTVRYFRTLHFEDKRTSEFMQKYGENVENVGRLITVQSVCLSLINALLVGVTMALGYWLFTKDNSIGLSVLVMVLPMVFQVTFWSGWIMREVAGIFENLGKVQEFVNTVLHAHHVKDSPRARDLSLSNGAASIRYKDVCFQYNAGQKDDENKPVLKAFNLSIPAGQKVGLVGLSGAGKSTIINLLMRAYDVQSGEILINDQNIIDVTQESLCENITFVTQENYLFDRSVGDNIRYAQPGAPMDKIIEAAQRANAHDFILQLEDENGRKGYDAVIGERGVRLSGGQRQRISIARAILKDSPILILDEATAALDSKNEVAIQDALETVMRNKTAIVIAHRLSTLRKMDRVIYMKNGAVVEDGTHRDLLSMKDGHYAHLWSLQ